MHVTPFQNDRSKDSIEKIPDELQDIIDINVVNKFSKNYM